MSFEIVIMVSGQKESYSLKAIASLLRQMASWMKQHLRKTEWLSQEEGSFYNGYYDNHCNPLEGKKDHGMAMTLTSQVFPIMSGTATEQQVAQITKAADTYLYDKSMGGYKLNTDFGYVKDDMISASKIQALDGEEETEIIARL